MASRFFDSYRQRESLSRTRRFFRALRRSSPSIPRVCEFGIEPLETRALLSADLDWAMGLGGGSWDVRNSVATDATGNVYLTGAFHGTVDFDPGPGVSNLTASGGYEGSAFVAKYSSAGAFLWARGTQGGGSTAAYDIATDSAGNVYSVGTFGDGAVDFNPGAGVMAFSNVGTADGFVMKLDTNGNFLWARQLTGTAGEGIQAIAIDSMGNVCMSGSIGDPSGGTVDFDPGPGTSNLTVKGFVWKLDSAGTLVWASGFSGSGTEADSFGITTDAAGNVYTTGRLRGTIDFDPGPGTSILSSIGSNVDVFIVKLNSGGNLAWARTLGGGGDKSGANIAVDAAGHVYTTGPFLGTVDFDPGPGVFNLFSADGDTYLSKLDSNGNFVSAISVGGAGWQNGRGLALDPNGNIYLSGMFSGSPDFDPGPGIFQLASAGSTDVFIVKLSSTGQFDWAARVGGPGEDGNGVGGGSQIVLDALGSVLTSGYFRNTADFDPGPGAFTLTSHGDADLFVVKLTQQTPNTPPIFTSAGAANVPENSTDVMLVTASDDQVVTFSISGNGADDGRFTILPTGELSFNVAPDFETPLDANADNIYEVEVVADDGSGGVASQTILVSVLNQASITGSVFVDVNGNQLYDANEPGIDGVVVQLLDGSGNPVLDENNDPISTITSDGGYFLFEDLDPANYQLRELQPSGVNDGAEILGSLGGSVVADDIMALSLAQTDAADYDFGELGQTLASGDTASIGFWQNKHGQALIAEGGVALATWLSTNFDNVFGNAFTDGFGDDGAEVATYYKNELFKQKSTKSAGPAKVDAQFMATALATFFTSSNLAGSVAAGFGFNVTDTGIGTSIINVGNSGAAFGVADGTSMTIMQLLLATNSLTDQPDNMTGAANVYDLNGDGVINAYEAWLRSLANQVYSQINGL